MTEQYKVLAAFYSLGVFTVPGIAEYAGVTKEAVERHFREYKHLFDEDKKIHIGKRGGQVKQWRLKPDQADVLKVKLEQDTARFQEALRANPFLPARGTSDDGGTGAAEPRLPSDWRTAEHALTLRMDEARHVVGERRVLLEYASSVLADARRELPQWQRQLPGVDLSTYLAALDSLRQLAFLEDQLNGWERPAAEAIDAVAEALKNCRERLAAHVSADVVECVTRRVTILREKTSAWVPPRPIGAAYARARDLIDQADLLRLRPGRRHEELCALAEVWLNAAGQNEQEAWAERGADGPLPAGLRAFLTLEQGRLAWVRQEADRAEKLVRAALHEFDAARDGEMADRARNLLNEMAAGRATRAAAIAADMPADAPPGLQEVARRLITETLEALGIGLAARGGDADSVVTCAYGTESGAGRRMRQSDNTRYRRADSWYPSHMAGAA